MSISKLTISTGPTSVLILEDNPQTLTWLIEIAAETFPSAKICSAETLKSAINQVQKDTFDLVLVDLGLPDGSGITLIQELRTTSENTYIVVATMFDDDQHLINALQAGANGYLLKNEPRETLIDHLKGIATSRAPISNEALDKVINHFNRQTNDMVTLTTREEEVLQLVAKGYNVAQSAEMLGLSPNTVKSYLKAIYSKLGISSRAEATAEAIKRQLIQV